MQVDVMMTCQGLLLFYNENQNTTNTKTPKTWEMGKEYEIVIATEEDREKIVEFLRTSFYKHEPLNVVNGTTNGPDSDAIYSLSFIPERLSLLALSRTGDILGVSLNGEERAGVTRDRKEYMSKRKCENYSTILEFLNKVECSVDIWEMTGWHRALHIHLLAVDVAMRGRGIGRALMERTRDLARVSGFPLLYILCSSYFSAQAAHKMGMTCIFSMPYSKYTDQQGTPLINPPLPHREFKIFIQEI